MIWPEIDNLFLPFFEDIQIGVSDQDLISRLVVNQNEISICSDPGSNSDPSDHHGPTDPSSKMYT